MIEKNGISISKVEEEAFSCGLFSCVEYCVTKLTEPTAFSDLERDIDSLISLKNRYGVDLRSFHLPFVTNELYTFNPSSLSDSEKTETLNNTKKLIEIVSKTDMKILVLHGSLRVLPEERSLRLESFVDYLRVLCDYCKGYGMRVAVETLKPRCIGNSLAEHLYIQKNTKRDNLGICFDSNHLLTEDNLDFLRGAGEYVITTHLSDYDGIDERHWFPGRGINDWKAITSILEEKGYTDPYVFEVRIPEDENKTLTEHYNELVTLWKKCRQ